MDQDGMLVQGFFNAKNPKYDNPFAKGNVNSNIKAVLFLCLKTHLISVRKKCVLLLLNCNCIKVQIIKEKITLLLFILI